MIVITNMESLPEYCYECPCHDGESGYCQADKERRYSEYRPYWCPLKEIHDDHESGEVGMNSTEKAIIDLIVAKRILCNPQMLTPEMCVKIGQAITSAIALMKEQEEPKPGHWIAVESPTGVEAFGIKEMAVQTVRCSVCGTEEDVSFSAYRFCPKCGTKMEGR